MYVFLHQLFDWFLVCVGIYAGLGLLLVGLLGLVVALRRVPGWCARVLYPEYAIPVLLGVAPVVLLTWALLR